MASTAARSRSILGSNGYRLLYVITAGVVIAMAITTRIAWSETTTLDRQQVEQHMSTHLTITHEAVSAWATLHRQMTAQWADSATVSTLTQGLLEISPTRIALLASPLRTAMSSYLAPALAAGGYFSYAVVSRDGLTLDSSLENEVGTQWMGSDQAEFLARVWADEAAIDLAPLSPPGVTAMQFAGLIRTADSEGAAVLIFTADPARGFTDILKSGEYGETGETYAFDRAGHLMNESRFADQLRAIGVIGVDQSSVHNVSVRDPGVNLVAGEDGAWPVDERPLTRAASEALAGRNGSDLDGYRDYRGVDVVGTWLWDETLGLGIASEIDRSEVFAVINHAARIAIASLIVGEFLILAMALVFVLKRREQEARIAAESEFRSITEVAADAIISADSNGTIRSWNPAAEVMFGFSVEEAIGMDLATLMPESLRDAHRDGLRRIREGGQPQIINSVQLTAMHRDGTEFPIELTLGSWDSSDGRHHSAILRDITERVRIERERAEHQEQLERLLDSKSELVASVSHELRTPLTSIIGFTDLLLRDRDTLSSVDLEEMTRAVAAESSDLAHMVEDLLVATRTDLEEVPISLERVDLASAANDTIDRMSALLLGGPVPVNGRAEANADPDRVRQILRNLVSNAVRHGGDRIHIKVAQEGRWATLSVRDNGDEIPSSERDRIFERYGIATGEHRSTQSIGLGLPVSRRLAELMGGSLTYRHQDGESIFDLTLPSWPATTPRDATEHREADHGAARSESLSR